MLLQQYYREQHQDVSFVIPPIEFISKEAITDISRALMIEELHREVVSLNISRIKCRLRSRHARRSRRTVRKGIMKPSCVLSLREEINNLSIQRGQQKKKTILDELRLRTEYLYTQFIKLEAFPPSIEDSSEVLDILMRITKQAHELGRRFDIGESLGISQTIDPSTLGYVIGSLRKLGRYYSVSCDLIDAARRPEYLVFNKVSVETLIPPACNPAFITNLSSFDAALLQVENSVSRRTSSTVKMPNRLAVARKRYESRRHEMPTSWKVHAEIQLLFFYESRPDIQHPRMICSSKSACYLCHLFIEMHGKFEVYRTHSRIYEKWLLPDPVQINFLPSNLLQLLKRFNGLLEDRIANFISLSLQEQRRIRYSYPNESIAGSFDKFSSISTICVPQAPPSAKDSEHRTGCSEIPLAQDLNTRSCTNDNSLVKPKLSHSVLNRIGSQNTLMWQVPIAARGSSGEIGDGNLNYSVVTAEASSPAQSTLGGTSECSEIAADATSNRLPLGIWVCRKLTCIEPAVALRTGFLCLYLSWEPSKHRGQSCWVWVKWIKTGDLDEEELRKDSIPIDVGRMQELTEMTTEQGAPLCNRFLSIRCSTDICLIKYSFHENG